MKYFEKLDLIFTILLIADILIILGSVLFNISREYVNFILLFDTVLCIVLIISFIMKYRRANDKKTFLNKNWLDLLASFPVAIVILPFLSSTLYTYNAIVLVRLLRLILLLKVLSRFVEGVLETTSLDKFIAIFIVIILGSALILYDIDPNITSLFDAIWFVFQTITTVGYGDVIPTSPLGKFIVLLLLIAGVFMFSIVTASFAYVFNDKVFKKENKEFNKRVVKIRDHLDQTVTSIGEIKERVDSNDKELAEIKESINNLSRDVDYLIEIIEKKE